jgi:hypothetical protein
VDTPLVDAAAEEFEKADFPAREAEARRPVLSVALLASAPCRQAVEKGDRFS